jgi:hypothetical protein
LVPAKSPTAAAATSSDATKKFPTAMPVKKESIYIWYIKMIGVCLFATATFIFVSGQTMRYVYEAVI